MLKVVVALCLLAASYSARCPEGVRGFAGPSPNHYFDCRKGGREAELVTCEEGTVYDRKHVTCSEPILKRSSDEQADFIRDQIAMGEPIRLGTLYNQRTNQLYHGYELYTKETLQEITTKHTGSLATEFEAQVVSSTRESRAKFGIGAELELGLMSGLIEVKGSAEYAKDDIKSSNTARVYMKKITQGDIVELDMNAADPDFDFCSEMGSNTGPTHFVSRITYGQRAFQIFEKDVAKNENAETIKGRLEAKINLIPDLVIEGHVAIDLHGREYKNDDRMKVKFYGDTILEKVPTTWLQSIETFNTVLDRTENGEKKLAYSSPIKYSMTPLSQICKSMESPVIRRITDDLVNSAINNLDELSKQKAEVTYLLGTDAAIRYTAIREQLIIFKGALETFHARMATSIATVLPLLKAARVNEEELSNILAEFSDSPFQATRAKIFLDSRKKEIDTIQNIINTAIKDSDMLLSDPVSATDNECVFKDQFGTVFLLNILPDLDLAQRFIADNSQWTESNSWVNTPRRITDISNKKNQFEAYVKANVGDSTIETDRCYMLKLGTLDMTQNFLMSLFEEGTEIAHEWTPPSNPISNATLIDTSFDGFTLAVDVGRERSRITHIEVTMESVLGHTSQQVVENADEIVVSGLLPSTNYSVTYKYIVEDGHGKSASSPVAYFETTTASAPVALTATPLSSSSIELSWAAPNTLAFPQVQNIVYLVKRSPSATPVATTELSHVISGLSSDRVHRLSVQLMMDVDGTELFGDIARVDAITAPPAPAAPIPGQIQDNRARFQVNVGDVTLPDGVNRELLSIKYVKTAGGDPVYFIQRLQDQGNTEIDIANFESGTSYSVQVKLLVRFGGRLLGSAFSDAVNIETTETGSPIDNLQDTISNFQASSRQSLDQARDEKNTLKTQISDAENRLGDTTTGGEQKIALLNASVSKNFAGLQQTSNVLQQSRCHKDGIEFWENTVDIIATVRVNSMSECSARCADTDGCAAASVEFVHSGSQITSRNCQLGRTRNGAYFWGQKNHISTNLFCQLSEASTIDTWQKCIVKNKDFNGGDVPNTVGHGFSSIEECVAYCQRVNGCVSVTYARQTKNCYPKNRRNGNQLLSVSNVDSVNLMCLGANRGGRDRCTKEGVRFTGSLVSTSTRDTFEACVAWCVNLDGCEAVSYNSSSRSCEANRKRLGDSEQAQSGWKSLNIYCQGIQHF